MSNQGPRVFPWVPITVTIRLLAFSSSLPSSGCDATERRSCLEEREREHSNSDTVMHLLSWRWLIAPSLELGLTRPSQKRLLQTLQLKTTGSNMNRRLNCEAIPKRSSIVANTDGRGNGFSFLAPRRASRLSAASWQDSRSVHCLS